ncbi:MAG: hypothetical protein IK123_11990, partial [Lachnospiraceae bacterium]|nr:hypothetical protein [Lachnospiraceae bacterium]
MSEINVLYPFDNNYAPFAGISMTSLLENNRDAGCIRIYVLGFDLSDDNIERLRATAGKYNREIIFIDPKPVEEFIKTLDMPSYRGAVVAVARLLVTRFIPDTVRRLLYLDSDTVITGNLGGLIDADLGGKPVGMVCDSVAGDYKKI